MEPMEGASSEPLKSPLMFSFLSGDAEMTAPV